MLVEKTVGLPMLEARAGLEPSTLDAETRTVEVVWTTGARGKREGFFNDYYEELAIEPENVRLDRFVGAPVRDSHMYDTVRDTLGVVEEARPVKSSNGKTKEWRARIRFAKSPNGDEILALVQDGVVRHVSVGYYVNKYEELAETQDRLPILRAIDWEPVELSFVNIPFDAGATVRAQKFMETRPCVIQTRSIDMPKPVLPVAGGDPNAAVVPETMAAAASPMPEKEPAVPPGPPLDRAAIEAEAKARAIADVNAIRQAAIVARASEQDIERYVALLGQGQTADAVRAAIVQDAVKRQTPIDTTSARVIVGSNLEAEGAMRGIGEALLARAVPETYGGKVTDAGRRFQRDSVLRLAERLLEAHGVNTEGLSRMALLGKVIKFRSGAHDTSDFFWLFESLVSRRLQDEANRIKLTYLPLAVNEELPDFRESRYVIVGDSFQLKEIKESEEISYGTFTSDSRAFKLGTFARGIKWTRQMMINDDLSVLSRLPAMIIRAAEKLKSRMVWEMIVGNGTAIGPNGIAMSDGNPLFAAVHGNLAATAGPITKAAVAAGRKAIRAQRAFGDKSGADTLDLEPGYLIVGPEQEQAAIDFLAANFVAVNQADAAALNLTRSLKLIVENRIIDQSWYMASTDIAGIVTATLRGESGVFLDTDEDFETDGYSMKGRIDFGVHMARWEGWYKNAGA
jgi:hypothetical protein